MSVDDIEMAAKKEHLSQVCAILRKKVDLEDSATLDKQKFLR